MVSPFKRLKDTNTQTELGP